MTRAQDKQDTPTRRPAGRLRPRFLLAAGALLVIASFAALFIAVSYREHVTALRDAARITDNLLRVLDQHAQRVVRSVDQALTDAAESVQLIEQGPEPSSFAAYQLLDRSVTRVPQIRRILVVDAAGILRYSSETPVPPPESRSGDDAVAAQRGGSPQTLFIGTPVIDRNTGEWLLPMSRPFHGLDGTLRGVLIAHVDLESFLSLYRTLDVGAEGVIVLFRSDGAMIVRKPMVADLIGQIHADWPLFTERLGQGAAGFFRSSSPVDGVTRWNGFRDVGGLPLIAMVGLDERDVLAAWRSNMWSHAAAVGTITVIIAVLAALLLHQWRQREAHETALEIAERDFRSLFDNSPDGHYRRSPDGRPLRANAALARLAGCQTVDELGEDLDIFKLDWYVDPNRGQEFRRRLLRDGEVANFVSEIYRLKTGERIWVAENARLVRDAAGKTLYYDGSVRDIGEQRRAEEALREAKAQAERVNRQLAERNQQFDIALDNITHGLVLHDGQQRLLVCNRRFLEIFNLPGDIVRPGVTRAEIVDYLIARDAPTPEAARSLRNRQHRLASSARRRLFRLRLADGRLIEGIHQPLAGFGAVQTFTDVTRRERTQRALRESRARARDRVDELEGIGKRLRRQGEELAALATDLSRARDEAETTSRTKSTFLANMSHELRTPLNAIIGFSEVMKDEVFGPIGTARYREYARDVHESGIHLLTLINEVLDLAKVESGRLELREEPVDVAQVIAACHRLMIERAATAKVVFAVAPLGPLPRLIADELRVKQILLNLVSNAIKFTPSGGNVTLAATTDAEGGIVISVRDTGIGMRPEDIPLALEPFGQIDGLLDRRQQGTGLGLPLATALIELHGGRLEIESAPGQGTTVAMRFPARRSASGTTAPSVGLASAD